MSSALIVLPLSLRFDHYVVFLLFLLFSFAFNDLVDRKMDKDGHPERPLPSERISPLEATLVSAILFALGVTFTNWCAPDLFPLFTYAAAASAVYSRVLKRHVPLIGTPIWSFCVMAVVCWPAHLTGTSQLLFFIVLYMHEVLLDMRDSESDRIHCTTPSIATLLGKYCGWYVALLALIASNVMEGGYATFQGHRLLTGELGPIFRTMLISCLNALLWGDVIFEMMDIADKRTNIIGGIHRLKVWFPLCIVLW